MADETLAWRVITPGHKVLDAGGAEIGTVSRVLGDDGADIFHGIALRRRMLAPELEIVADRIDRIGQDVVHTTLSAGEVDSLPHVTHR